MEDIKEPNSTKLTQKSETPHNNEVMVIPGSDLRKMRIYSGLTASYMAEQLGLKSRKTIENWERDFCAPSVNHWLNYCLVAGFDPSKVVTLVEKRNRLDPTMKQSIDLELCLLSVKLKLG